MHRRGVYRRASPEYLHAPPQPRPSIDSGALEADEDDDSIMRTARQAAAEIDWYESVTETAPVTRQPKKTVERGVKTNTSDTVQDSRSIGTDRGNL